MSNIPIPHSLNVYDIRSDYNNPVKGRREEEEEDQVISSKQLPVLGMERYDGTGFLSPAGYGSGHLEHLSEKETHQLDHLQQTISEYWMQCDSVQQSNNAKQHPSLQSIFDMSGSDQQVEYVIPDLEESSKEKSKGRNPFSATSQELLSNYQSGLKKLVDGNSRKKDAEEGGNSCSAEELVRLAGEKYIQFSSNKVSGYTMFIHPYGSSAFSSLSVDETREVELAYQLLTAAEKVSRGQFDLASKILTRCEWVACEDGSPIERLVFHFAQALRKKIEKETGIIMSEGVKSLDRNESYLGLGSNPSFLACHQELPFSQVLQFTGIQAVIDHVGMADKIHLIDLNIRSGVQWTVLMQALADQKRPLQLLTVTAIGTKQKHKIEETGKRLRSFAQSLSLPFSFKIIFLSDIKDLKKEDFSVEANEAVAVYSHTVLRTMISRPDRLEHLMGMIGKIKPLVIVMAEVEANHNSTSFVNRFTETLFFYSAFFDCLEDCMARDNEHRMILEGVHLAAGIQNVVSAEGEERTSRSVRIDVWRSFFARYGIVEVGFSDSSLYQAKLVCKQFSSGSSCTLETNGKCLLVGWKGTPLHSLSTWKFL